MLHQPRTMFSCTVVYTNLFCVDILVIRPNKYQLNLHSCLDHTCINPWCIVKEEVIRAVRVCRSQVAKL